MKNLKQLTACFLLCIAVGSAFAQRENNNWCFGYNTGLNFNTSPPTFFRDSMQVWEGSASVSDAAGNLLFYTSGALVWDKNHSLMLNGTGLKGNGSPGNGFQTYGSSQHGVVIIKSPANPDQYYIITTDANEDELYNAYYSVVDMSLNGGLGDVAATEKNTLLATGVMEGITVGAMPKCVGFWAILHKRASADYYAFKIDITGCSTTPVISTGILTTPATTDQLAQICIDPQSSRLARSVQEGVEIASFNRSTGQLYGFVKLDQAAQNFGAPIFSPDGSRLYSNNLVGDGLYQYDVSLLPNLAAAQSSKTLINGGPFYGSKRIGPDGKIYCKNFSSAFIDVINYPNLAGSACGFTPHAMNFPWPLDDNTFTELGSPVLSNSLPVLTITDEDTAICDGHQIQLHAEASAGSSYLWSTGSTAQVSVTNGPARYTVTATNTCGSVSDSILVSRMDCKCYPFVPNAFTPNSDGKNDALKVFLYCIKMSAYHFAIYNRYGQKVFDAWSLDEVWDGTCNGKPADTGTYFYILKYKDGADEEVVKKGDIVLIR